MVVWYSITSMRFIFIFSRHFWSFREIVRQKILITVLANTQSKKCVEIILNKANPELRDLILFVKVLIDRYLNSEQALLDYAKACTTQGSNRRHITQSGFGVVNIPLLFTSTLPNGGIFICNITSIPRNY